MAMLEKALIGLSEFLQKKLDLIDELNERIAELEKRLEERDVQDNH